MQTTVYTSDGAIEGTTDSGDRTVDPATVQAWFNYDVVCATESGSVFVRSSLKDSAFSRTDTVYVGFHDADRDELVATDLRQHLDEVVSDEAVIAPDDSNDDERPLTAVESAPTTVDFPSVIERHDAELKTADGVDVVELVAPSLRTAVGALLYTLEEAPDPSAVVTRGTVESTPPGVRMHIRVDPTASSLAPTGETATILRRVKTEHRADRARERLRRVESTIGALADNESIADDTIRDSVHQALDTHLESEAGANRSWTLPSLGGGATADTTGKERSVAESGPDPTSESESVSTRDVARLLGAAGVVIVTLGALSAAVFVLPFATPTLSIGMDTVAELSRFSRATWVIAGAGLAICLGIITLLMASRRPA